MDRPENILFRTKDPSSDIVIADFGMWVPSLLTGMLGDRSHSRICAVPNTSNLLGSRLRPSQGVTDMLLQRYSTIRGTASLSTSGLLGIYP